MSCSKRIEYCGLLSVATTSGIPCHANKDFELLTIKTEIMLLRLAILTNGSFHVKSSDFWPFSHGPSPILWKFGTLVGIV